MRHIYIYIKEAQLSDDICKICVSHEEYDFIYIYIWEAQLSDDIYKICASHEEYVEHLLYICSKYYRACGKTELFINNVSKKQSRCFSRMTGDQFSAEVLINGETNAEANNSIVIVVIWIAHFEIWKIINMFPYKTVLDPMAIAAKKIKWGTCHFQILGQKLYFKYVNRCIERL